MTPEQRAEKMHSIICYCHESNCPRVALVAAQIREAEDRIYWIAFGEGQKDEEGGYPAGRQEALEEAAKIAESFRKNGDVHKDCIIDSDCEQANATADAIRALKDKK